MTSSPRKFSEKIALHAQRQAEGNAAFDKIMKDVSNINREPPAPMYGVRSPMHPQLQSSVGGSLPNVAMMDAGAFQVMPRHDEMHTQSIGRNAGLVCRRVYHKKHMDNTPYTQHYLTPPSETGWRRTHSDSSLHITAMGGGDTGSYPAPQTAPVRSRGMPMFSDFDQGMMDGDCKSGPWDAKKLQNRPKSCEVPGINIYPSEQETGTVPIPIQNTGSLPDLTNIHIPTPLMTPLDNDEQTMYNHSSTNNLQATTVQILGMSQSPQSPQSHSPQPRSPQLSPAISPQIQRRNKTNPVAISLGHHNQGCLQMQDSGGMVMDQSLPKYQVFQNQPPQSPQHSSNILSLDKSGMQQYRETSSVGPTTSCSSPTSPVSNPNFSPAASPGPPGSVGCPSPALSDAYSQRILQQQFEDFTMVGDHSPTHQPSQYQFPGMFEQNYFGNPQSYHHKVPPPAYHQPFPQYPQVNNIPSIILSGVTDSQDMAKDIHSAMVGYDHESLFSAEDSLKLDPLECEDFQMLLENDPVTDQTTEDSFRADRMGGLYK
ncbi:CREB-regulated transcription coactivator 1-like isoform X2 [Antedon mediterranea]|uniref:CREB-regulated transcription coactivator 1-like isoform X2 n=1 Tax=Antedon mediterranea TaxID=105859 RepID=UPI003AF41AB5